MGNILKQTGDNSGANAQYRQAVTTLNEIKKEPNAEHGLERVDPPSAAHYGLF